MMQTTLKPARFAAPTLPPIPWTALLLFSVIIGLAAGLWGYRYATGNQVEQLPVVLRALDPNYLTNDFFVNASANYSPRTNYAYFLAFFGRAIPLPVIFLAFTLLGNIAIALVTALFAYDLFDRSLLAALLASAAVMTLKTFWLGYSNILYRTFLEPVHLAAPLLMLSIWAGFRMRPLPAVLLAGLASIFHSLAGLETGAIVLAAVTIEGLLNRIKPGTFTRKINWVSLGLAWAALAFLAALSYLPYRTIDPLTTREFIDILARFRHPHHYLPSTFGRWQYIQATLFLIPSGLAWLTLRPRIKMLKTQALQWAVVFTIIAGLCLGGYLFVERFPSRLWTIAQTFRLLWTVKWLCLIVLAGWLAVEIERAWAVVRRPQRDILPLVALAGVTTPVTLPFAVGYTWLRRVAGNRPPWVVFVLSDAVVLGLLACLIQAYGAELRMLILFPLFSALAMVVAFARSKAITILSHLSAAAIVAILLFVPDAGQTQAITAQISRPLLLQPDVGPEEMAVAEFARQNTPPDAIFMVNPSLGIFRVLAERAIVVDFISFPFEDHAMLEWQKRIYDLYGVPEEIGFEAVPEMRNHYTGLDDNRIGYLQKYYGFDYAVLYRGNNTRYPILFETESYKIVQITPRASEP